MLLPSMRKKNMRWNEKTVVWLTGKRGGQEKEKVNVMQHSPIKLFDNLLVIFLRSRVSTTQMCKCEWIWNTLERNSCEIYFYWNRKYSYCIRYECYGIYMKEEENLFYGHKMNWYAINNITIPTFKRFHVYVWMENSPNFFWNATRTFLLKTKTKNTKTPWRQLKTSDIYHHVECCL